MMASWRTALPPCLLVLTAAAAAGCSTSVEADQAQAADDCSTVGQNRFLFELMKDVYLWHDLVPDVAYEDYPSPEALLQDLVHEERDRWSYIMSKSDQEAYYDEARMLGFGFRWMFDEEDSVRFAMIYPGSPVSEAGLRRGDKVLEINGLTIDQIAKDDLWEEVSGPDEEGYEMTLTIERAGAEVFTSAVRKAWFTLTSVLSPRVVQAGPRKAGYFMLTSFVEPTRAELDSAFAMFREEEIDDLILDLRYNGGGRLDVERHLASLIHQPEQVGALLDLTTHNQRHREWDKRTVFEELDQVPAVSRLVVITSGGTASASEVLINSLRPYLDVTLVGSTTHGKPVGMYGWHHCDKTINPIAFRVVNADGEGDYFDGMAPDCVAEDALGVELGDASEASLAEALHVLEHGACSASAAPAGAGERRAVLSERRAAPRREIPWRGFRREVGAL
jgi:C-terminal processing protease CtpA/Prc